MHVVFSLPDRVHYNANIYKRLGLLFEYLRVTEAASTKVGTTCRSACRHLKTFRMYILWSFPPVSEFNWVRLKCNAMVWPDLHSGHGRHRFYVQTWNVPTLELIRSADCLNWSLMLVQFPIEFDNSDSKSSLNSLKYLSFFFSYQNSIRKTSLLFKCGVSCSYQRKNGSQQSMNAPIIIPNVRAALCSAFQLFDCCLIVEVPKKNYNNYYRRHHY